jgi:hypothetical protein
VWLKLLFRIKLLRALAKLPLFLELLRRRRQMKMRREGKGEEGDPLICDTS